MKLLRSLTVKLIIVLSCCVASCKPPIQNSVLRQSPSELANKSVGGTGFVNCLVAMGDQITFGISGFGKSLVQFGKTVANIPDYLIENVPSAYQTVKSAVCAIKDRDILILKMISGDKKAEAELLKIGFEDEKKLKAFKAFTLSLAALVKNIPLIKKKIDEEIVKVWADYLHYKDDPAIQAMILCDVISQFGIVPILALISPTEALQAAKTFSSFLKKYPLVTKALTAAKNCGLGTVMASLEKRQKAAREMLTGLFKRNRVVDKTIGQIDFDDFDDMLPPPIVTAADKAKYLKPEQKGIKYLTEKIKDINLVDGTKNCVNCSIATDMTLAGREMVAMDKLTDVTTNMIKSRDGVKAIFGVDGLFKQFEVASAVKFLDNLKDGTRGFLVIYEDNKDFAHILNFVAKDNIVFAVDGQAGIVSVAKDYFNKRSLEKVEILISQYAH